MRLRRCRRFGRKRCTAISAPSARLLYAKHDKGRKQPCARRIQKGIIVDFALPDHLPGVLAEIDAFIDREIKPLERENMQYFDQRREYARTDWENGGIPARAWEDLLNEMRRRADKAGWLRYGLPASLGG